MFNFNLKEKYKRLKYRLRDLRLWLAGAPTVHCIGDSHLLAFEFVDAKRCFKHTRFKFCIVHGATAMGIPNPASKTQAGPIFNEYLRGVPLDDYILFCLGEVDCGFVIWYRSKKYSEPVDRQFDLAVGNYIHFLEKLELEGRKKLMVCSSPLPTIKDGQKWGEIATLRNDVESTQRERTDMTLEFNRRLADYCKKRGHIYLDFESYTLNRSTGLIDDSFLNPDKLDHHLDPEKFAKVIVLEMKKNDFN